MAFVFSHGGDYGDTIFSLMAVHDLWLETGEQSDFWLYRRPDTRVKMTESHAAGLLPLIRRQPYIRDCGFRPAPLGVRLDESVRSHARGDRNLADTVTEYVGLPLSPRDRPWLYTDARAVAPVVVGRSPRYRSQFPWTRAWQHLKDRAVFVGLPDEHRDFCRAVGQVPYHPTADMAELTAVLAGARLCVLNQSSPQACAEGLKKPILIERPHETFTTHWARPDAWYAHRPRDPLPDLGRLLGLPEVGGIRLDDGNCAVGAQPKRYNGSIIRDGSRYLIAFRAGSNTPHTAATGEDDDNTQMWIAELGLDFRPTGQAHRVLVRHPQCSRRCEDPRLFRVGGKLHLSFSGVAGQFEHESGVSAMYARLGSDLRPEAVWYPHYPQRASMEKNWSLFDYRGDLKAVYSIRPHRILDIDGDAATLAHETAGPPQWSGGVMRGGAAPVLVGDRWYHFFHGVRQEADSRLSYHIGCYAFDAAPPFRVLACTPHPLLSAGPEHDNGWNQNVVFTCGAVREGDEWVVCIGFADQWIEIRRWPVADVEAALVPL